MCSLLSATEAGGYFVRKAEATMAEATLTISTVNKIEYAVLDNLYFTQERVTAIADDINME
jgi:hypothetical protein